MILVCGTPLSFLIESTVLFHSVNTILLVNNPSCLQYWLQDSAIW